MKDEEIHTVIRKLRKAVAAWRQPAVTTVAEGRDPFLVLISTLLSLRTRDAVTAAASSRLFAEASTPAALARLTAARIEKLIYPACFYRVKARTLRKVCGRLLERHGGRVPDTIDALLALPGVGRKTANLVVTLGFGKPGVCVDTHVHRIANRLGYVRTRGPEETELALRAKLPRRYWNEINDLLVAYGQNLCQPVSPWCTRCVLSPSCPRLGVRHSR
ncbi:MAG: endonuclease III [Elusimicrobia bacterium]|nr:endonuclease III [Elusimicrobiota bacterium]